MLPRIWQKVRDRPKSLTKGSGGRRLTTPPTELQDAAYTLPRTMILATTINGGLMFIMAITLCYVIGDLSQVLATPTGYPFVQIFMNSTRSVAATNAMTSIVIILSYDTAYLIEAVMYAY